MRRENSGIFFRPFALPVGPKISVPSGISIRSLSFRASSRYVFPSKDDVPHPPDCRKGTGERTRDRGEG